MKIAFWYISFEANHVSTQVLNTLASNLAMIQISFHSCVPFPIFNPSKNILQGCLSNLQIDF